MTFNEDKTILATPSNNDPTNTTTTAAPKLQALRDIELASLKIDGRVSIEHQINLYVGDLTDISARSQQEQSQLRFGGKLNGGNNGNSNRQPTPNEISLLDVFHGLKYVMDYRIRGSKMPNLDAELMKRLMEGLLRNMGHKKGNLLNRRPTEEANMAFVLFGEFLEEVQEFRDAVGNKNVNDLRHALKIHRRCTKDASPELKLAVVALLGLLTGLFPQFSDWRELVDKDDQDDVEDLMLELAPSLKSPTMPFPTKEIFPPQALWFEKDLDRLFSMFKTTAETGLSTDRVATLTEHYGPNKLPQPPKPSLVRMFITQITDFMVIVLLITAIAAIPLEEYVAAVFLATVICLNVAIGFSQEYKANKALEALESLTVAKAKVFRNSTVSEIDAADLVPGDIVVLEEGDAVPADLRLIETAQLQIIESILTGESVPVQKETKAIKVRTRKLPLGDCKANAFMSTMVAKGRGRGIVVRTGDSSEIGRISAAITSQAVPMTPIQLKIKRLALWLVSLCFILCVFVVIIGSVNNKPFMEMLKLGMTLAISAIPEGLVAVVTVTQSIGVARMAARSAIVKRLPCVETLGSVTYICSDKTGTLTEGKMGPSELWTSNDSNYQFTHSTSLDPTLGTVQNVEDGSEVNKKPSGAPAHLVMSMMVASLCNNATLTRSTDETATNGNGSQSNLPAPTPPTSTTKDAPESGEWKVTGDPTEVALVIASQKSGFMQSFFKENCGFTKLGEFAFDSDRKLMSVVYNVPDTISLQRFQFPSGSGLVMVKGAPEAVLTRCTHYMGPMENNTDSIGNMLATRLSSLDDSFVDVIANQATEMASKGLRVLALAVRLTTRENATQIVENGKDADAERDLCFVGLIGLMDPPKQGVKEAVETCRRAGIRVVMITGDHITTASAIAKKLTIFDVNDSKRNRAMKGTDLDMLNEEQLANLDPFPVVFARVSPDNKLQIVKALQSKKQIAAMTGDGVNDAPAIKKADIGVAMGIGGTEITKQAADIVLTDDNFTTIVEAVREGRRVFDNIQKFIVYLLSCNMSEILIVLLCTILNIKEPFEAVMLLWANIFADIPPAMALGLEPPEPNIMLRKPRKPDSGVLPKPTLMMLCLQILVITLLPFGAYYLALNGFFPTMTDKYQYESLAFLVLTVMQLCQSFLSRSVFGSVFSMGLMTNKWIWIGNAISVLGLMTGFYVPAFAEFLEFKPPDGVAWGVAFICVFIQVIVVELGKLGMRRWLEKKGLLERSPSQESVDGRLKVNDEVHA